MPLDGSPLVSLPNQAPVPDLHCTSPAWYRRYYQFLRLGYAGYRKIMTNLDIIRKRLINAINKTGGWAWVRGMGAAGLPGLPLPLRPCHHGWMPRHHDALRSPPHHVSRIPHAHIHHPPTAGHFEVLSKEVGVPVVAFRLKKVLGSDGKEHRRLYDEFALADRLRMRGWVLPGEACLPGVRNPAGGLGVPTQLPRSSWLGRLDRMPPMPSEPPGPSPFPYPPLPPNSHPPPAAYTMPDDAGHVKLMRVTIREDFSIGMADMVGGRADAAWQDAVQP